MAHEIPINSCLLIYYVKRLWLGLGIVMSHHIHATASQSDLTFGDDVYWLTSYFLVFAYIGKKIYLILKIKEQFI